MSTSVNYSDYFFFFVELAIYRDDPHSAYHMLFISYAQGRGRDYNVYTTLTNTSLSLYCTSSLLTFYQRISRHCL